MSTGTRRIDGNAFEKMIKGAAAHLKNAEKELNSLNVFPVADGDTGTNMRLTLENGMKSAGSSERLSQYLKNLSTGLLLSARGNSGVILSQLFKGIYLELSRCSAAGTEELRNAFIRAHIQAYSTVIHPVEGTILTVAREGIENIKQYITRELTIEDMLRMYIAEMEKVLQRTPDLLPILKESGVIDSGGKGYITLIRGMLAALTGEAMPEGGAPETTENKAHPDLDLFNENSVFEKGYCMEFILQGLNDRKYVQKLDIPDFIRRLGRLGDSLVVVPDERRVKVHIHTKKPADIIMLAQIYGEFLTFKLENMQVQHNEYEASKAAAAPEKKREHRPVSFISVANGEGFKQIFTDQGCDFIVDGGSTMSVSAKEFLDVFEQANCDLLCVLPNSGNVLFAAEQARELYDGDKEKICVIPTRSIAEGYFAMAMDMPDEPDKDRRLQGIRSGAEGADTLSIARTVKDFTHNGREFHAGMQTAFLNGEPVADAENFADCVAEVLSLHPELTEKETFIAFRGKNATDEEAEILENLCAEQLPFAGFEMLDGGQETYHWVIGLL